MTTENWQNKLYTGDNLYFLHGLNSESVDLIYLDPPFNSKRTYSAPVGSKAAGASFKDMWTWDDVNEAYLEKLTESYPFLVKFIYSIQGTHSKAMMSYVVYMTQRIIELHRILKETGSLYLHCDPTASHYLKVLLDEIFGRGNFRNEIVWSYKTGGASKNHFARKHDIILFYCKSKNGFFNSLEAKNYTKSKSRKAGVINYGAGYEEFFEDEEGVYNLTKIRDVWDIPYINSQAKERTGYPTQKPLALLHRIIESSCPEDGAVLDPFCGCATTCVAAQELGMRWIGIDIEKQAVGVLVERLANTTGLRVGNRESFIATDIVPKRTDIEEEPITNDTKKDIKERLFKQQQGHCNGCNLEFNIQNFEIDHIIPKAKGGCDYFENYQLLCGSCNRIKGARPMDYLRMKIKVRERLLEEKYVFGG